MASSVSGFSLLETSAGIGGVARWARSQESRGAGDAESADETTRGCRQGDLWYDCLVITLADIKQLPLHEKLLVMEALWDGISREEDKLEVPEWHKEILDEREQLVAEGKAKFIDWETAKGEIRKEIS